jgi:16S rRNA (cytosine1402-N4)-methyltransferase
MEYHQSVLKEEALHYLISAREGWVVDATLGDGGHTQYILENSNPGVKVLGIDQDPYALKRAQERLEPFRDRVAYARGNFGEIAKLLRQSGIDKIQGLILDLGVSSRQLDVPERGFSFRFDGPLDMRMNPECGETAKDILENSSDKELQVIIRDYGEEKNYKRIVREIRKAQSKNPLTSTLQLANLISAVMPASRHARIHPATRTFQALRIAVNNELQNLTIALRDSLEFLDAAARVAVISFHSLEDRIVKNFFREEECDCVCPPKIPVCVCNKKQTLRVLTRRPIRPSLEEIDRNSRSASSKLRVAERVYV